MLRVTGTTTDIGWRIAQSANQQIHFGNQSTTVGAAGYLESTNRRDSIELVCTVADLYWNVVSSIGNITVV
jgi:CII-binding regulator of phage lambda lysogenization HflD